MNLSILAKQRYKKAREHKQRFVAQVILSCWTGLYRDPSVRLEAAASDGDSWDQAHAAVL